MSTPTHQVSSLQPSGVVTLPEIDIVADKKWVDRPEAPKDKGLVPTPNLLKRLTDKVKKALGVDVSAKLDDKGNLKTDQVEAAKKRVDEKLNEAIRAAGNKGLPDPLAILKETEFPLLPEKVQISILQESGFVEHKKLTDSIQKEFDQPHKRIAHFVKLKAREAEADKSKSAWMIARLYDTTAAMDPQNRDHRLDAARAKRTWAESEADSESKKLLLEESVTHLRWLLKKNPEDTKALEELKQTLALAGGSKEAKELAGADILKLVKEGDASPEVMKARAEVLGVLGRGKTAKQQAFDAGLKKAEQLAGKDPEGVKAVLKELEKDLGEIEKFSQKGTPRNKLLELNRLRRFYRLRGNDKKLAEVNKEIQAGCDKLRKGVKLKAGELPTAAQVKTAKFLAGFSTHLRAYSDDLQRDVDLIQDLETWKFLIDIAPGKVLNAEAQVDQYCQIMKYWSSMRERAKAQEKPGYTGNTGLFSSREIQERMKEVGDGLRVVASVSILENPDAQEILKKFLARYIDGNEGELGKYLSSHGLQKFVVETAKKELPKEFSPDTNKRAYQLYFALNSQGITDAVIDQQSIGEGAGTLDPHDVFNYIGTHFKDERVQKALKAAKITLPKDAAKKVKEHGFSNTMLVYHDQQANLKRGGGERKNAEAIAEHLIEACYYDPGNPFAYQVLAKFYENQGMDVPAAQAWAAAYKLDPENFGTKLNSRIYDGTKGAIEKADKLKAEGKFREASFVLTQAATLLIIREQTDPELDKKSNSIDLRHQGAEIYSRLGFLADQLGEKAQAKQAFQKAIKYSDAWIADNKNSPTGIKVYQLKAMAQDALGDYIGARKSYLKQANLKRLIIKKEPGETLSNAIRKIDPNWEKDPSKTCGINDLKQERAEGSYQRLDVPEGNYIPSEAHDIELETPLDYKSTGHKDLKELDKIPSWVRGDLAAYEKRLQCRLEDQSKARVKAQGKQPPDVKKVADLVEDEIKILEALGRSEEAKKLLAEAGKFRNQAEAKRKTERAHTLTEKKILNSEAVQLSTFKGLVGGKTQRLNKLVSFEEQKDGSLRLVFKDIYYALTDKDKNKVLDALIVSGERLQWLNLARGAKGPDKPFYEAKVAILDGDLAKSRIKLKQFQEMAKNAKEPKLKILLQQSAKLLQSLGAIDKDSSQISADMKLLLGSLVNPTHRDGHGRLNLQMLRGTENFDKFKEWLATQASVDKVVFNQVDSESSFFASHDKLLQNPKYKPLLKLLWAELKEDSSQLPKISDHEMQELFIDFNRDMARMSFQRFVSNHMGTEEGRQKLREMLTDPIHYDKEFRADLLEEIIDVGEAQGHVPKHIRNLFEKQIGTYWDDRLDPTRLTGEGWEKLLLAPGLAPVLLTEKDFEDSITKDEIRIATGYGLQVLGIADRREKGFSKYHEKYLNFPQEVEMLTIQWGEHVFQPFKPHELQHMARIVDIDGKKSDGVSQMRAKMANTWLLVADNQNWTGYSKKEDFVSPNQRLYMLAKLGSLIERSKTIKTNEEFVALNRDLHLFLNGQATPKEDYEHQLEIRTWNQWKESIQEATSQIDVGGFKLDLEWSIGTTVHEMFEGVDPEVGSAYSDLRELSDGYWAVEEMQPGTIDIEEPEIQIKDPKLKGRVVELVQALQNTKRGFWYQYKQQGWLYRTSTYHQAGQDALDLLEEDPQIRETIKAANKEIDGIIQKLCVARTPEEVEAQVNALRARMGKEGPLHKALSGVDASLGKEVLNVAQIVVEMFGIEIVTAGLGAVGALGRGAKLLANEAWASKSLDAGVDAFKSIRRARKLQKAGKLKEAAQAYEKIYDGAKSIGLERFAGKSFAKAEMGLAHSEQMARVQSKLNDLKKLTGKRPKSSRGLGKLIKKHGLDPTDYIEVDAAFQTFLSPSALAKAKSLHGFKAGFKMAIGMNVMAKLSGQLRTEPDQISDWLIQALATGISMAATGPFEGQAQAARQALTKPGAMKAWYKEFTSRAGLKEAAKKLGKKALDVPWGGIKEVTEEVLENYATMLLERKAPKMSEDEFRAIVVICAAGQGWAESKGLAAIAPNLYRQWKAQEKAAVEGEPVEPVKEVETPRKEESKRPKSVYRIPGEVAPDPVQKADEPTKAPSPNLPPKELTEAEAYEVAKRLLDQTIHGPEEGRDASMLAYDQIIKQHPQIEERIIAEGEKSKEQARKKFTAAEDLARLAIKRVSQQIRSEGILSDADRAQIRQELTEQMEKSGLQESFKDQADEVINEMISYAERAQGDETQFSPDQITADVLNFLDLSHVLKTEKSRGKEIAPGKEAQGPEEVTPEKEPDEIAPMDETRSSHRSAGGVVRKLMVGAATVFGVLSFSSIGWSATGTVGKSKGFGDSVSNLFTDFFHSMVAHPGTTAGTTTALALTMGFVATILMDIRKAARSRADRESGVRDKKGTLEPGRTSADTGKGQQEGQSSESPHMTAEELKQMEAKRREQYKKLRELHDQVQYRYPDLLEPPAFFPELSLGDLRGNVVSFKGGTLVQVRQDENGEIRFHRVRLSKGTEPRGTWFQGNLEFREVASRESPFEADLNTLRTFLWWGRRVIHQNRELLSSLSESERQQLSSEFQSGTTVHFSYRNGRVSFEKVFIGAQGQEIAVPVDLATFEAYLDHVNRAAQNIHGWDAAKTQEMDLETIEELSDADIIEESPQVAAKQVPPPLPDVAKKRHWEARFARGEKALGPYADGKYYFVNAAGEQMGDADQDARDAYISYFRKASLAFPGRIVSPEGAPPLPAMEKVGEELTREETTHEEKTRPTEGLPAAARARRGVILAPEPSQDTRIVGPQVQEEGISATHVGAMGPSPLAESGEVDISATRTRRARSSDAFDDLEQGLFSEWEAAVRGEVNKSITPQEATEIIRLMRGKLIPVGWVDLALEKNRLSLLAQNRLAFEELLEVDMEIDQAMGGLYDNYFFVDQLRRKHGLGDPTSPVAVSSARLFSPHGQNEKMHGFEEDYGMELTVRTPEEAALLLREIAFHSSKPGLDTKGLAVVSQGEDFIRLRAPMGGEFVLRVSSQAPTTDRPPPSTIPYIKAFLRKLTAAFSNMGKTLTDLLSKQNEKTAQLSFLRPDMRHVQRVLFHAEKLLNNSKLQQELQEKFGSNYQEVVRMAAVLSKIGFGHQELNPTDNRTYIKNRIFAVEILDKQLKPMLMESLGLNEAQYSLFREAILREGTFGIGTSDLSREVQVAIKEGKKRGIDLEGAFYQDGKLKGKYDNPLTALLTIAAESDVSTARLQVWQTNETLMKALIRISSDPVIQELYIEKANMEIKRSMLSPEELTAFEKETQGFSSKFNRRLREVVQREIFSKKENFIDQLTAELELQGLKKEKAGEIALNYYDQISKNMTAINSDSYLWFLGSYGIQDIRINEKGEIILVSPADLFPKLGAAANMPHVRNFHQDRLADILWKINKAQGMEFKIIETVSRENQEVFDEIQKTPKADTHTHLKMAVDFDLYIWNGTILSHDPHAFEELIAKSDKLMTELFEKGHELHRLEIEALRKESDTLALLLHRFVEGHQKALSLKSKDFDPKGDPNVLISQAQRTVNFLKKELNKKKSDPAGASEAKKIQEEIEWAEAHIARYRDKKDGIFALRGVFKIARETALDLHRFVGQQREHRGEPHREYHEVKNKDLIIEDAKQELAHLENDLAEKVKKEGYTQEAEKLRDQIEVVRRMIELYERLKFYVKNLFNFQEGALTNFVPHFIATSTLLKISEADELPTLKRITKEVLTRYQADNVQYFEPRFNIGKEKGTLDEVLTVIQAYEEWKAEELKKDPDALIPDMKIILSITKFDDPHKPYTERVQHKTESAKILIKILEEARSRAEKNDQAYEEFSLNPKEGDTSKGSYAVKPSDLLKHLAGIDAAGQEEYNPPSLFFEAFALIANYNSKVLSEGRDDLVIGGTFHVSESNTDVSTESALRYTLDAIYMKPLNDVDGTSRPVMIRLGHAIVPGISDFESLLGKQAKERVAERIRQIDHDLKLLQLGLPLQSVDRAGLIKEKEALLKKYPTIEAQEKAVVELGKYTPEKIKDLELRAAFIRDRVIELGIVVETNPTSNLGISPFITGYQNHTLKTYLNYKHGAWARDLVKELGSKERSPQEQKIYERALAYLENPDTQALEGKKVRVTINTDDLTLFGTNMTEEFYRMAVSLGIPIETLREIIAEGFNSPIRPERPPAGAEAKPKSKTESTEVIEELTEADFIEIKEEPPPLPTAAHPERNKGDEFQTPLQRGQGKVLDLSLKQKGKLKEGKTTKVLHQALTSVLSEAAELAQKPSEPGWRAQLGVKLANLAQEYFTDPADGESFRTQAAKILLLTIREIETTGPTPLEGEGVSPTAEPKQKPIQWPAAARAGRKPEVHEGKIGEVELIPLDLPKTGKGLEFLQDLKVSEEPRAPEGTKVESQQTSGPLDSFFVGAKMVYDFFLAMAQGLGGKAHTVGLGAGLAMLGVPLQVAAVASLGVLVGAAIVGRTRTGTTDSGVRQLHDIGDPLNRFLINIGLSKDPHFQGKLKLIKSWVTKAKINPEDFADLRKLADQLEDKPKLLERLGKLLLPPPLTELLKQAGLDEGQVKTAQKILFQIFLRHGHKSDWDQLSEPETWLRYLEQIPQIKTALDLIASHTYGADHPYWAKAQQDRLKKELGRQIFEMLIQAESFDQFQEGIVRKQNEAFDALIEASEKALEEWSTTESHVQEAAQDDSRHLKHRLEGKMWSWALALDRDGMSPGQKRVAARVKAALNGVKDLHAKFSETLNLSPEEIQKLEDYLAMVTRWQTYHGEWVGISTDLGLFLFPFKRSRVQWKSVPYRTERLIQEEGYPPEKARKIAEEAIGTFLNKGIMKVEVHDPDFEKDFFDPQPYRAVIQVESREALETLWDQVKRKEKGLFTHESNIKDEDFDIQFDSGGDSYSIRLVSQKQGVTFGRSYIIKFEIAEVEPLPAAARAKGPMKITVESEGKATETQAPASTAPVQANEPEMESAQTGPAPEGWGRRLLKRLGLRGGAAAFLFASLEGMGAAEAAVEGALGVVEQAPAGVTPALLAGGMVLGVFGWMAQKAKEKFQDKATAEETAEAQGEVTPEGTRAPDSQRTRGHPYREAGKLPRGETPAGLNWENTRPIRGYGYDERTEGKRSIVFTDAQTISGIDYPKGSKAIFREGEDLPIVVLLPNNAGAEINGVKVSPWSHVELKGGRPHKVFGDEWANFDDAGRVTDILWNHGTTIHGMWFGPGSKTFYDTEGRVVRATLGRKSLREDSGEETRYSLGPNTPPLPHGTQVLINPEDGRIEWALLSEDWETDGTRYAKGEEVEFDTEGGWFGDVETDGYSLVPKKPEKPRNPPLFQVDGLEGAGGVPHQIVTSKSETPTWRVLEINPPKNIGENWELILQHETDIYEITALSPRRPNFEEDMGVELSEADTSFAEFRSKETGTPQKLRIAPVESTPAPEALEAEAMEEAMADAEVAEAMATQPTPIASAYRGLVNFTSGSTFAVGTFGMGLAIMGVPAWIAATITLGLLGGAVGMAITGKGNYETDINDVRAPNLEEAKTFEELKEAAQASDLWNNRKEQKKEMGRLGRCLEGKIPVQAIHESLRPHVLRIMEAAAAELEGKLPPGISPVPSKRFRKNADPIEVRYYSLKNYFRLKEQVEFSESLDGLISAMTFWSEEDYEGVPKFNILSELKKYRDGKQANWEVLPPTLRQKLQDLYEFQHPDFAAQRTDEASLNRRAETTLESMKLESQKIYEELEAFGEVEGSAKTYDPKELEVLIHEVLERGQDLMTIPKAIEIFPEEGGLRKKVEGLLRLGLEKARKSLKMKLNYGRNYFTGEKLEERDFSDPGAKYVYSLQAHYRFARMLLNQKAGRPLYGHPSTREMELLQSFVEEKMGLVVSEDYHGLQQVIRDELFTLSSKLRAALMKATQEERALVIQTFFGASRHVKIPNPKQAFAIAAFLGRIGFYRELGVTMDLSKENPSMNLTLGDLTHVTPEDSSLYFLLHTHPNWYGAKGGGDMGDHATLALDVATEKKSTHGVLFSDTDIENGVLRAERLFHSGRTGEAAVSLFYDQERRVYKNWVQHSQGVSQVEVFLDPQGKAQKVQIKYGVYPPEALLLPEMPKGFENDPIIIKIMEQMVRKQGIEDENHLDTAEELKKLKSKLGIPVRVRKVDHKQVEQNMPFAAELVKTETPVRPRKPSPETKPPQPPATDSSLPTNPISPAKAEAEVEVHPVVPVEGSTPTFLVGSDGLQGHAKVIPHPKGQWRVKGTTQKAGGRETIILENLEPEKNLLPKEVVVVSTEAHSLEDGQTVHYMPFGGGGSIKGQLEAKKGKKGGGELKRPPTVEATRTMQPDRFATSVPIDPRSVHYQGGPSLENRGGGHWRVMQNKGDYYGEIQIIRGGELKATLGVEDDGKSFPLESGDQVNVGSISFIFIHPDKAVEPKVEREISESELLPAAARKGYPRDQAAEAPSQADPAKTPTKPRLQKTDRGWELSSEGLTVIDPKTRQEKAPQDGRVLLRNGDIVQQGEGFGKNIPRRVFRDGRFYPMDAGESEASSPESFDPFKVLQASKKRVVRVSKNKDTGQWETAEEGEPEKRFELRRLRAGVVLAVVDPKQSVKVKILETGKESVAEYYQTPVNLPAGKEVEVSIGGDKIILNVPTTS